MNFFWMDKSDSGSYLGTLAQYLTQEIVVWLGYFRRNRLEKLSRDAKKTQEDVLKDIIRVNGDTVYGLDFQLKRIQSRDQFIRQHPLTHYSHYESYFNRAANGERNVVCSKKILLFGRTSGTTGKSKIIPVTTDSYIPMFFDAVTMTIYQLFCKFPEVQNLQKRLHIHFTPIQQQTDGGITIGLVSGSPKKNPFGRLLGITPMAAYDILTEPEAIYVYLLFALKERSLGAIESNFASIVYITFKTLEAKWQWLVNDIRNGSIDIRLNIPVNVRQQLELLLKPDKIRADELEDVFKSGFDSVAKKIWPKMKVIFTISTGNMEIYSRILKAKYCKGILQCSMFYGSTEGLIGINLWPEIEDTRYLVVPTGNFFEFIPEEDCDQDNPQTKFMEQLSVNHCYEVVITNYCGLYRYRMGDIVRVVGFHNTVPIIQFLHRNGQILNINSEKFAESLFYRGLKQWIDQWENAILVDYTCVESILLEELETKSEHSSMLHYIVFIELLWDDGQQRILNSSEKQTLDICLQDVHPGYKRLRSTNSVASADVVQVKPGAFYQLRQALIENGSSSNQFKLPRVLRNVRGFQLLMDHDILKH